MLRVGLTGGLATGKSFVGETLVSLGCHLLKADELGHAVLSRGGEAFDDVVAEFGPGVLDASQSIDRRLLSAAVFEHPDRLTRLNALVHPHVVAREEAWFDQLQSGDPASIGVIEAAILIETGSYKRFDRLILTVCSEQQQIERAMKRDHMTREEALARIHRQMPLDEKRKFANYVIDTSNDKQQTVEQIRAVFSALRSLHS